MKNILVTGAHGFIGKHMCLLLERHNYQVFKYDISSSEEELLDYLNRADFIVHLAGANRPIDKNEFYEKNSDFSKKIVDLLLNLKKNTPIIMSSSIQATLDNDYGKSKKIGEEYLLKSGLPVYVFRLSNVFGKWCKPNYNSVVATFCYNIAHDLPIEIRDKDHMINLNFVEDVTSEFLKIIEMENHTGNREILSVNPTYPASIGHIAELLYYFKYEVSSARHLPIIHDEFELKLFKTFCDYLSDPQSHFNYVTDERGSFEELFKSEKYGQISENIIHPGIVKGGHYHTYKKEIFYTVIGSSEILQRNINNNDLIKDVVDASNPHMIRIIPNYTHQIKNIGDRDSHTLMWINKIYDLDTADTYYEPVLK